MKFGEQIIDLANKWGLRRTQMAALFGVSWSTFQRWLKKPETPILSQLQREVLALLMLRKQFYADTARAFATALQTSGPLLALSYLHGAKRRTD